MIRLASTASVLVATVGLAVAFLIGGLWVPAALVVLGGGLWVGAQRVCVPWINWAMMGSFTAAAAGGALLGLGPHFLLVGLTGAVSAWDLEHFRRQLGDVNVVERRAVLSRRHLARVLLADVISLIAASAALRLRIELSFAVAVLLGLMALIGLSRVMTLLRREEGT